MNVKDWDYGITWRINVKKSTNLKQKRKKEVITFTFLNVFIKKLKRGRKQN